MQHIVNTDTFFSSYSPIPWEMPICNIATSAVTVAAPSLSRHEQQMQIPQFDQYSFMQMMYTIPSPTLEHPALSAPPLPAPAWYTPDSCAPVLINHHYHHPYYLGQAQAGNQLMPNTPPSPPLSVVNNEGFMPSSPLPSYASSTSSASSTVITINNSYCNSTVTSSSSSPNTIYQCPSCTKQFTRPYNLKSHLRTHTNDRPYACDQDGCPWKFARPHDLKRHQLLHSGHKPHKCLHCEKRFARCDALRRHWKVDLQCGEAEERMGPSSIRRYRQKKNSKQQKH